MTPTVDLIALAQRIEALYAIPQQLAIPDDAEETIDLLLSSLEAGLVRAAVRDEHEQWVAVPWVKRGILAGFRVGRMVDQSVLGDARVSRPFTFFDKHTYPTRALTLDDGIRVVPGGSSIRRGAFVARGVVCMPPMFVNVGAYVGAGTMVDSHALVGSCAQIGERVHLSAAAQIGGVLEPVNASPVVIEDDVVVGGNCGVYEGTVVRARAVLAAGVVLTRGTPVFDLVQERVLRAPPGGVLQIPAGAVVVPGARQVGRGWGQEQGLSLQTPVIVKYRDDKTDTATALEGWLR
ncbi:MAG: 2,3,4,5-tetrahydropyridine-2,6-dicarboxylate N-succinyltransferase [Gemmatimonadota bacterium]|nr:2,3,4,5-tetrahydropyridine-2,6-dicarboxylate N-succinyltransferase [Gemmatimonadota bacterium]